MTWTSHDALGEGTLDTRLLVNYILNDLLIKHIQETLMSPCSRSGPDSMFLVCSINNFFDIWSIRPLWKLTSLLNFNTTPLLITEEMNFPEILVRSHRCHDSIEPLYYVGGVYDDICIHCSSEDDLRHVEVTDRYYPQCQECTGAGKKKILRKTNSKD